MSIWASFGGFDRDDDPVRDAPIVYRQSHVLPSPDDPRGGTLDLASIPAFITHDGHDESADDELRWPFLRLSLRPSGTEQSDTEDTVVLDAEQVIILCSDLLGWLAHIDRGLI